MSAKIDRVEATTVPRQPTIEMLNAGRKQIVADRADTTFGPSAENVWKAMWDAAVRAAHARLKEGEEGVGLRTARTKQDQADAVD